MHTMVLKRKYSDHQGWQRVLEKNYVQESIHSNEFQGNIALLHTILVSEPLSKRYGDKEVCIVDSGYMWLHQVPIKQNHAVTAMFNEHGDIVQWYIDICYSHGIEKDVLWMDDLFLDIVVFPSGEMVLLDEDELEEAYQNGDISRNQYDLARDEANKIMELIKIDQFPLIKLSGRHKKLLEEKL